MLCVGQLPTELFGKLSSVVKSKSAEMKEKLSSYIKNEQQAGERSVHTVCVCVCVCVCV